jgi:hypothetical protein
MRRIEILTFLLVFGILFDSMTTYTIFQSLGISLEFEQSSFIKNLIKNYGWFMIPILDLSVLSSSILSYYLIEKENEKIKTRISRFCRDVVYGSLICVSFLKIDGGLINTFSLIGLLAKIDTSIICNILDVGKFIIMGTIFGYILRSYIAIHHHEPYVTYVENVYVPILRKGCSHYTLPDIFKSGEKNAGVRVICWDKPTLPHHPLKKEKWKGGEIRK